MTRRMMASKIWLMDVGAMLLWPWKKPLYAEIMQMMSTHGARAAMAAQLVSEFETSTESGLLKRNITRLPTMPMVRKT